MRHLVVFAAALLAASGAPPAAASALLKAQAPSSQPDERPIALPQPVMPATAAQPAPFSGDVFVRGALVALHTVNNGGAAGVYDGASATMQRALSKDQFIAAATRSNARAGSVTSREWTRIDRLRVDAPAAGGTPPPVPPGFYVTVHLIAIGARGETHAEQVSFRQDEDNNWRLSGLTTVTPEAVPL